MSTTTLELLLIAKDQASEAFEKVGKAVEKTHGNMDKLKAVGSLAMAGVGLAAVDFAKKSVDAYTESQAAQAKLQDAYSRFPALTNVSLDSLRKLDDEIQKKTGYDNDQLAMSQASLAAYGLTGDQIEKLTPLVADYATKTGVDLATATDQVGKAMLGQGRALKTVGINFHDTKSVAGNFAEVTAGLTEKVGGLSDTMGQTASGKTKILAASMEDLEKKVGEKLVPVLSTLTDKLTVMVDWISANSSWLGPLVGTVLALAAAIKTWTVIQAIIDAELWANPVGIVVAAIVLLIAAVALLVTHWDKVRKAGAAAWEWIKNAWSSAGEWFSGIGGKISKAFTGIWDGLWSSFKSVLNKVIGAWNGFHLTIGGGTVLGVTIPSVTLATPQIPYLASGGTIAQGGLAVVGENGPEVVSLPAGATVHPHGSGVGSGAVIHIENYNEAHNPPQMVAAEFAFMVRSL